MRPRPPATEAATTIGNHRRCWRAPPRGRPEDALRRSTSRGTRHARDEFVARPRVAQDEIPEAISGGL
jgi:hypothetical protein